MNVILRPGDPCPCCGRPIKTSDPDSLLVLGWLAEALGGGEKNRPGNGAADQD